MITDPGNNGTSMLVNDPRRCGCGCMQGLDPDESVHISTSGGLHKARHKTAHLMSPRHRHCQGSSDQYMRALTARASHHLSKSSLLCTGGPGSTGSWTCQAGTSGPTVQLHASAYLPCRGSISKEQPAETCYVYKLDMAGRQDKPMVERTWENL